MYIRKKIGNMTLTFKMGGVISFKLISIGWERFFGQTLELSFFNVTLLIHYVSEKQRKAFEELMTSCDRDDDFNKKDKLN